MKTLDTLDRPLRDLRISVTDRCNFRCTYCMPKEVYGREHRFLDRRELLTFEEITRVARTFVALGTRKIRITGGEPLVRRDLERLVEQLAALDVDLTLTTNASLLAAKARSLADAGLQRVTVSLDALDDATFRAMNDVDFPVDRVLEGIDAAVAAGLPVKVNAVIKRGVNDDQVTPMAAFFKERGQIASLHRVHGRRAHERLAARRGRSRARDRRDARPGLRRRARRSLVPWRGRAALALPRWQRRGRCDRVGDAAVLRRLHPCTPIRRREGVHVPVRRPRHRPARADSKRLDGRRARSCDHAGSGAGAATATPSSARPRPRISRRSR